MTKQKQVDLPHLASVFDALVAQYKTPDYILSDPIQIPYRFVDDPKACELVGFLTALFSYGRRDTIIETVLNLLRLVDNDPVAFMESFNPRRDGKRFAHFVYRFNTGRDVAFLWERLQWAYREYGSLEALFAEAMSGMDLHQKGKSPVSRKEAENEYLADGRANVRLGIAGFTDALLAGDAPGSYGLKFLFAHPARGGACKRFNMFLRWMVREDIEPSGRVDFGLWKALKPADLIVPLDTHILKMNRGLRLSMRNDGSWKTAEEITAVFRRFCPEDPVKYDFALFGFSLDGGNPSILLQ